MNEININLFENEKKKFLNYYMKNQKIITKKFIIIIIIF